MEDHGIQIQFGLSPRATRVWIDGQEITRYITHLVIDASAGETVTGITLTLDLLPGHRTPPVVITGTLSVPEGALAALHPIGA